MDAKIRNYYVNVKRMAEKNDKRNERKNHEGYL